MHIEMVLTLLEKALSSEAQIFRKFLLNRSNCLTNGLYSAANGDAMKTKRRMRASRMRAREGFLFRAPSKATKRKACKTDQA
jgi:hypothetical protein